MGEEAAGSWSEVILGVGCLRGGQARLQSGGRRTLGGVGCVEHLGSNSEVSWEVLREICQ